MMLCVVDADTNAWMWGMIGGTETWIGLSDIGHAGTYTWVPGCPSTYTNWEAGEPNNLGVQDYAYFKSGHSGNWDNEGNVVISCACQYNLVNPCPSGWTYYNNNCYKFATALSSWPSCQSTCAGLNAMMLCVTDAATNAWIWSMSGGSRGAETWVGLSDIGHFGNYTWVPGCNSNYTNWDAGQPDQLGIQDYAYLWSGHNGIWDNIEVGKTALCVCQFDNAPSSTPTTVPTTAPSTAPTTAPSSAVPTVFPTANPSTVTPSTVPSSNPTKAPSVGPTVTPSVSSTAAPSFGPTAVPSFGPTVAPSSGPTAAPSAGPTVAQSSGPTALPSSGPTAAPSAGSTVAPSFRSALIEVNE